MSTLKRVADTIIAIGAGAVVWGCAAPSDPSAERGIGTENHAQATLHMKRAMHEMYNVLYDRHISELERDDERRRYAVKLSQRVLLISEEVRNYPKESGRSELADPEKKGAFMGLADRLKGHGEAIGERASNYDFRMLGDEIKKMVQTCNQCHAQFNPLAPAIE